MKIRIKTFASLKDILGFTDKIFDLQDNLTAGQVIQNLKKDFPDFGNYKGLLLIARNEEFCNEEQKINDGDVLALFPPVSGG
jgi:molybdopterin synthase sulfur carrier subunit